MSDVLDNPTWHALTGVQAEFALGDGRARRFIPEVALFGAIADDSDQAWDDLAALVGSGNGRIPGGTACTVFVAFAPTSIVANGVLLADRVTRRGVSAAVTVTMYWCMVSGDPPPWLWGTILPYARH